MASSRRGRREVFALEVSGLRTTAFLNIPRRAVLASLWNQVYVQMIFEHGSNLLR